MNEIRELTEMEVEAVSGGSPLVGPITIEAPVAVSTLLNIPVQTAVSIGGDAQNLINGGLTNSSLQLQNLA
jgi:hypothetical protein